MLLTESATGPSGLPASDLAEILFCTSLQPSWHAGAEEVRAAVSAVLCDHAVSECASEVAQHYGEDPETSCSRMRWCREQVAAAFQ